MLFTRSACVNVEIQREHVLQGLLVREVGRRASAGRIETRFRRAAYRGELKLDAAEHFGYRDGSRALRVVERRNGTAFDDDAPTRGLGQARQHGKEAVRLAEMEPCRLCQRETLEVERNVRMPFWKAIRQALPTGPQLTCALDRTRP